MWTTLKSNFFEDNAWQIHLIFDKTCWLTLNSVISFPRENARTLSIQIIVDVKSGFECVSQTIYETFYLYLSYIIESFCKLLFEHRNSSRPRSFTANTLIRVNSFLLKFAMDEQRNKLKKTKLFHSSIINKRGISYFEIHPSLQVLNFLYLFWTRWCFVDAAL
jgi:hypothetical protein